MSTTVLLINSKEIHLAQVSNRGVESVESYGTLSEAVRAARERGVAGLRIVVEETVPCFFRTVRLPRARREDLKEALPFEVEPELPVPLDSVLLSEGVFHPVGEDVYASVIAAMADKLDPLVEAVESEEIAVLSVDWAPVLTAAAVIEEMGIEDDRFIVDQEHNWMACVSSGRLIHFHRLTSPDLRREANLVRLSLPEEARGGALHVVILGENDGETSASSSMAIQFFEFSSLGDPSFKTEERRLRSLGALLAFSRRRSVPYRLVDRQIEAAREAQARAWIAPVVLVLLLLLFSASAWYTAHLREAAQLDEITRLMDATFEEAFPGLPSVDPLGQAAQQVEMLDEKSRELRRALSRESSPLAELLAVSTNIPQSAAIDLVEFNADPEGIKLIIQAQSYSAGDEVVAALQNSGAFLNVDVLRRATLGNGRIQMEITAEAAE